MFHCNFSTRGRLWLSGSFMLVLIVGTSQAFWGNEIDFSKLNTVLIDSVPTNELQANLDKANQLLRDETAKKSSLVEPLKLLLRLNEVVQGDDKCSLDSYSVVVAADKATGGVARAESVSLRRVDKLVRNLASQRANVCLLEYTAQVDAIKEHMDAKILHTTYYFMRGLEDAEDDYFRSLEGSCAGAIRHAFNRDYWKLGNSAYAQQALFTIEAKSRGDPDAKYLKRVADEKTGKAHVDRAKLKSLYKKYLVEPCEEYIRILGPTLDMIKEDCKFLDKPYVHNLAYIAKRKVCSELEGRGQLELCQLLVNRDRKRLFKEIYNVASWRN